MDHIQATPNGPTSDHKAPPNPASILVATEKKSPENPNTTKPKEQEPPSSNEKDAPNVFSRIWLWIKRDTTSTDWLIVLLTAVIAGTSYLQWHEIRAGGSDTHTLAEAAKKQADKMETMSGAADKIREAAEGMVTQEQRLANNADKTLAASSNQSKISLDATIRQFKEEQRAWVGLGPYQLQVFTSTEPLKLILPWTNSGKTPAVRTESAVAYAFPHDPMDGPPKDHKYVFEPSSAIPPQGAFGQTITNILGPENFQPVTDGTIWMYFFGQFRYHDAYTETVHTTSFCLYYDRRTKQMSFCPRGNTMD